MRNDCNSCDLTRGIFNFQFDIYNFTGDYLQLNAKYLVFTEEIYAVSLRTETLKN